MRDIGEEGGGRVWLCSLRNLLDSKSFGWEGEAYERMAMRPDRRVWMTGAGLGVAFDFLFWRHVPGISWAIFVCLCFGVGVLLLHRNGQRPAAKALPLLGMALFFAFMTLTRREPMTVFLASSLTLFLMALFAVTCLAGRWMSYGLLEYVVNLGKFAGCLIWDPLAGSRKGSRSHCALPPPLPGTPTRSRTQILAVIRGSLIALPILAVFAGLLSSADPIFARRVKDILDWFRIENLPEYFFRLSYMAALAWLFVGAVLYAANRSKDEHVLTEGASSFPAFLGLTEAATVLGSVMALFLSFVLVQFTYFFGGQSNILEEGLTYSEYARKGFGELVAVAVLSLLLFLVLSLVVKRETSKQQALFSRMGIGLVVLVGIMLVSAFQRLLLYEEAYGFTRQRTYTHVFMLWLGILLGAVIVLEGVRRQKAFALAAFLSGMGFVASLGLVNVDGFVARHNVRRAWDGGPLDLHYLASLSTDGVPGLVRAYHETPHESETRESLRGVLACVRELMKEPKGRDWREWTLSRWRAERTMKSIEEDLEGYKAKRMGAQIKVYPPRGPILEFYLHRID